MQLKVIIDGFGVADKKGPHEIQVNEQDTFLDAAVSILVLLVTKGVLPPFVELNSIAFLSFMRQLFTAEHYRKPVKQITIEFGDELILVEREGVHGPDLSSLKPHGSTEPIKDTGGFGFMSQFTSEKKRAESSPIESSPVILPDDDFPSIKEAGALMREEVPAVDISELEQPADEEKEMDRSEIRQKLDALRSELGVGGSPPAGISSPAPPSGPAMPSPLGGGLTKAKYSMPRVPATSPAPAAKEENRPSLPSTATMADVVPVMPPEDKKRKKALPSAGGGAMALEETLAAPAGEYDKNVAVEYFEVMNPQKVYPLVIDLSDAAIKTKATKENIITGERQVQKKGEMHVALESPVVTVVPVFPGCVVAPTTLKTNFDKDKDKLTFYITPLVQDDVKGYVEFVDAKGDQFHKMELAAEIKDPRYAKLVALYGVLSSVAPKVMEFMGLNVFALDMTQVLPAVTAVFSEMSLGNFIAMTGIVAAIIIALIYYAKQRDKMAVKRFYMKDFRLQALDMLK